MYLPTKEEEWKMWNEFVKSKRYWSALGSHQVATYWWRRVREREKEIKNYFKIKNS